MTVTQAHPSASKTIRAKKSTKLGRNPFEAAAKSPVKKNSVPTVAKVLRTESAKAPNEVPPTVETAGQVFLDTIKTAAGTQASILKLQAQVWILETLERMLTAA